MSRLFGGKRQNKSKDEEQVVLTSIKPLANTSQPALTSLTHRDDHQSAPESAINAKLNTDSVGSDMGRKFIQNSSQQDTDELLSPAAHNGDITENSNSEVPRPASLPQMGIDEDDCGLLQINHPRGELTPMHQPVPLAVDTPPDVQASVTTQSQPFPMNPLIIMQQRTRVFSDSKARRHLRSNVTVKQGSVKSLQQNNMDTDPLSTIPVDIQLLRKQRHDSVSTSGYCSGSSNPFGSRPELTALSPLENSNSVMATSEQQKTEQHHSDSKMTKLQKTEVRNKHSVSVVLTVFSDIDEYTQVEVNPIPEGDLLNTVAVKSQEDHSSHQPTKLREQVAEEQEIFKALSIGIGSNSDTLPEQVKLHIKSLVAENEKLKRQLSENKPKSSCNSLIGFEVVNEVELVVTNKGMSFHWEGYGLRLQIPENALPEGISECLVNIKVSLAGQFELPEGYELVSAVYWMTTPREFTKPVKIEAQHCANFSNPSQLCFVRASCSQKSLPYKFKVIDGGLFSLGNKYGALSTIHFSGNGIAKEVAPGEHSCQYCAQVYFTVKHLKDYWYYCHFVVTKDMEVCFTAVKRKYQQEYDIAPSITFGGDHIALDIPEDGIMADNGWQIVPVHKACIKKDRVDSFSSETIYVPECVLLLKWKQKDKAPDPLDYKVKLLGTGEENFFRIVHNPESHSTSSPKRNHSAAEESQVEESQVGLTIDDVLEVTNYLLDLTQTDIHNLGLTLGLNHSHLKNMASSETFRDDMIAAWLQKEDQVTKRGMPTWKTLVKALRDRRVNQTGVADKIETEKIVNA